MIESIQVKTRKSCSGVYSGFAQPKNGHEPNENKLPREPKSLSSGKKEQKWEKISKE